MSIGDTWRLALDQAALTYQFTRIQSDFGAPQVTSGSFTKTNSSSTLPDGTVLPIYNISTANGFAGNFIIDPRTKTAVGNFTWTPVGGVQVSSPFSATGYSLPATQVVAGKLDGNYAFGGRLTYYANSTEHPTSVSEPPIVLNTSRATAPVAGTFNVSGSVVTVCENGVYSTATNSCSSGTRVVYSATYDSTNNVIKLTTPVTPTAGSNQYDAPAGVVHVQAGDRGPVLTVDISKPDTSLGQTNIYNTANSKWSGARVVGSMLAGKLTALGSTDSNGTWADVTPGSNSSAVINGTSITLSPGINP